MSIECPKCNYENPSDSELCKKCGAGLIPSEEIPISTKTLQTPLIERIKDVDVGEIIDGKYKLIEALGSGGMGVVYKAEQKDPVKRTVALKVIKLGMDTKEVVARFDNEKQALAVMRHPHIAKVLDAGATKTGRPYFVMEFVPGIPITNYCDRHKLSTRERLELFIPLCEAVQHAHQKGVIHRDLKPSNVLVEIQDDKPVPKIIDFGIAKATEYRVTEKSIFTSQGQFIGTPEYMSPEQAETSGLDIDTRTDVYSLGVLLYKLLVGVLPFDLKELRQISFEDIRRKIREEEPLTPSKRLAFLGEESVLNATKRGVETSVLIKQLRGDLDWIVMKALEKDRTLRYDSASAFAADIARHLKNQPVVASPPSTVYRIKKFVRRNKLGVVAALAVFITLVVGIAGLTYGLMEAVEARNLAAEERSHAQAEAEKAKAVNTFLQNMLASPDPRVVDRNVKVMDVLDRLSRMIKRDFADQPEIEAEVRLTLAQSYNAVGSAKTALDHIKKSNEIRERILGTEHPDTLRTLNTMANVLSSLGRLKEAEDIYFKTLETRRRMLGEKHPDTLLSMNNLGVAYNKLGRYLESVDLLRKTLDLRRKVLGPDHSDVYVTLSNLSNSLRSLGDFKEAEKLSLVSLEKMKQIIEEQKLSQGLDHPDVLYAKSQYSYALYSLHRFEEAEQIFRELIESRNRVLGPEHGITLWNRIDLADTLMNQQQLQEAEDLYRTTLKKQIEVLGIEHPATLTTTARVAYALNEQDKFSEAEAIYQDTIERQKRILGLDHPTTLGTIHNLARCIRDQNRYKEAEELLRQTLEEEKRILGEKHPDTLYSVYILAGVIREQGRLEEAEALYSETMSVQEELFGRDNPDTLASLNALAITLCRLRKFDKAEILLLESIESKKRAYGPEHLNTTRAMGNLAGVWSDSGEYEKSEKLIREVIEILERAYGADHPDTLITKANLGEVLNNQGKYEETEGLLRGVLERMQSTLRENHPYTMFCKVTLGYALEKQGKKDEEERIRQEIKKNTQK